SKVLTAPSSRLDHDGGDIVAAAGEVSIQQAGDETGMPAPSAAEVGRLPACADAVAVHDEEALRSEVVVELGHPCGTMAEDAVVGDQMPAHVAGHDACGNIADAAIAHAVRTGFDERYGPRGAARRVERAIDSREHVLRAAPFG